jgi:hypothetical protein
MKSYTDVSEEHAASIFRAGCKGCGHSDPQEGMREWSSVWANRYGWQKKGRSIVLQYRREMELWELASPYSQPWKLRQNILPKRCYIPTQPLLVKPKRPQSECRKLLVKRSREVTKYLTITGTVLYGLNCDPLYGVRKVALVRLLNQTLFTL